MLYIHIDQQIETLHLLNKCADMCVTEQKNSVYPTSKISELSLPVSLRPSLVELGPKSDDQSTTWYSNLLPSQQHIQLDTLHLMTSATANR